jgi:hypothetical protein
MSRRGDEMNKTQQTGRSPHQRRPIAPLTVVLAVIMSFFCAILIFVYIETKRANPVMLDQQGRPLHQGAQKTSQ